MTEVFDSEFHRRYVGGTGEIAEKPFVLSRHLVIAPISMEQVLHEYRIYVRDPKAELPEEILNTFFLLTQRTENDRE